MEGEELEQRELLGRQLDDPPGPLGPATRAVDAEIADFQDAPRRCGASP